MGTVHANTREPLHFLCIPIKISYVSNSRTSITLRDFALKSAAKIRIFFHSAKLFFSVSEIIRTFAMTKKNNSYL